MNINDEMGRHDEYTHRILECKLWAKEMRTEYNESEL